MIHHLLNSKAVVVETTGRNPNVYYELGIAHAHHRPVVLIVDNAKRIPSMGRTRRASSQFLVKGACSAKTLRRPKLASSKPFGEVISPRVPLGPVAAAEGRLTPPDISGAEAGLGAAAPRSPIWRCGCFAPRNVRVHRPTVEGDFPPTNADMIDDGRSQRLRAGY